MIYGFDKKEKNRLGAIIGNDGKIDKWMLSFDENGRLEYSDFLNLEESYEYDDEGRLIKLTHKYTNNNLSKDVYFVYDGDLVTGYTMENIKGGELTSTVFYSINYTYDENGNISQIDICDDDDSTEDGWVKLEYEEYDGKETPAIYDQKVKAYYGKYPYNYLGGEYVNYAFDSTSIAFD